MRATLKDVAKLAGVNFTLVSKYINGNPQARMRKETRERIDKALRELKYQPSATARTLRSGRSRTIGLISRDLTNSYTAHFANLALKELHGMGYQLLIALAKSEDDPEALETLLNRQVDGIIGSGRIVSHAPDLPCPAALFDTLSPADFQLNLDLEHALDEALKQVDAPITGLFFRNSCWGGAFQQAARRAGLQAECFYLPLAPQMRLARLRQICKSRPHWIFSNGWHTISMLQELLDDEFADWSPKLLLHANCTGPFLSDPRVAGVIHSSSTALIHELCSGLVSSIEGSKQPRRVLLPTRYLAAGTADFNKLLTRHFQLT